MTFALTPDAEIDLLDIASEIGRDNPQRAPAFIEELLDRTALVANNPQLYRLRLEWGEAVRCARHGNYLILFELDDEGVLILRYLHGRRNIAGILSEDSE